MKTVIDSVSINNRSGVAVRVQLEDDFTQDVSAAVSPNPIARSAFPFDKTIPANSTYDADVNSLQGRSEQGCVALGNLGAICDSIQATCSIFIYFHFE
jgi:hypothetical protein